MASWSKNRKSLYGGGVVLFLLALIVIPSYFYLYKPPTCFDGMKNGKEQGVDCGGLCSRLCQDAFMPADATTWARFEEVAPHLYNLADYIINPNTEGEAVNVPYHIVLYDSDGVLITDRSGVVTIPPHRNTIAFIGAVPVANRVPARASFEFTSAPDWHKKVDPLSKLTVSDQNYTEDSSGSSLTVKLNNSDVVPIENVSVYVVLYGDDGSAIGFSKTILDEIPASGSAIAPFTWQIDRHGKVFKIEVLPVQEE